jgi:hypothetical protein
VESGIRGRQPGGDEPSDELRLPPYEDGPAARAGAADSGRLAPPIQVRARARRTDLPGLRPLDDDDDDGAERSPPALAQAAPPLPPLTLEDSGARPASSARKFCRICASWRASRVCPVCHIDLDTGDLARDPRPEELGAPVVRDERSGRLLLIEAPTLREWLRAGVNETIPSLTGASVCFVLSWLALSFREIPLVGAPFPWPGRLMAGFVGTVWLVERARAARSRTSDLDFVEIGGVLLRAGFLFPLLAGLASGHVAAIPVAIVLAPIFPLVLGALVTETPLSELGPRDLLAAWGATASYLRTMLWFALTLGLAIVAVGWDDGPPLLRAVVATLGATSAGTLAGLARRSAEHVPDL